VHFSAPRRKEKFETITSMEEQISEREEYERMALE
jgi:hypothetical protein